MTWEVLWALILGFALSAMVQAVVSKREMRRLLPDDSPRTLAVASGLGRGLVVVLVRGGGAGPVAVPQGRRLHGGDGVPVRLHQPRPRARDHHDRAARVAVHARRVRRGPADDRDHGAALPDLPQPAPGGGGAGRGREGPARPHGRARGDGHVHRGRRPLAVAAAALARGLHGHGRLLRHGLGRRLEGHLRRPAHRRRPRCLGPRLLLAAVLPRAPSGAGQALGPDRRAAGGRRQLRVLHRQRAPRGRALERRHQLRRRPRASSSPT